MNLPEYPSAGQPLSASWARQLLDYIRAITPRPSATVRVTTLSGGTVLSAVPGGPSGAAADKINKETDLLINVDWDDDKKKLVKRFRKGRVEWTETEAAAAAREDASVDIIDFARFTV